MKTSPIRYMGNKRKLINRGLIELFPKQIDTFYDLFGGSGIVGLNTHANHYVLNELDEHVYGLYRMFQITCPDDIINHTLKRISEFQLPTFGTDKRKVGTEVREKFKKAYMSFREYYNLQPNPYDLYVLMNYAMSQTMRFNKKGEFNMPFGNNYFIADKHGQEIRDFHQYLQNVELYNNCYTQINIEAKVDNFVYVDPPYLGSVATYNENGAWSEADNQQLLDYLNVLNEQDIQWGMSNILKNKHSNDLKLVDWVKEHGYNIHYFNDFDYYSFGRGKSQSVEVYIDNYNKDSVVKI